MKWGALPLAVGGVLWAASAPAFAPEDPLREASRAITELDLDRAGRLLGSSAERPAAAYLRARLAIYLGDCGRAVAILSSPAFSENTQALELKRQAEACAGATAMAQVVEVAAEGIEVRLQDDADRVLVPRIADVAARARAAMRRELGVELPPPLRIDLVRDSFSLAAVSGLPVEAADTTGTVAIARYGRVIMLSPRAAQHGYPWRDTLAHEIVHLAVTRATQDRAPLWLQEGMAKIFERAWRGPLPFDDEWDANEQALTAQRAGRSVGVTAIGASIALLPSPEAAATAYAEVASFVLHWRQRHGQPALELLLRDLRGATDSGIDGPMVSVTGFPLSYWIQDWRRWLGEQPATDEEATVANAGAHSGVARLVRLGDLLAQAGHAPPATQRFEQAVQQFPSHPALRWRLSRSLIEASREAEAVTALGQLDELAGPHAGWFALNGRFQEDEELRDERFEMALGLDPYLEEAACRGEFLGAPPRATRCEDYPSVPEDFCSLHPSVDRAADPNVWPVPWHDLAGTKPRQTTDGGRARSPATEQSSLLEATGENLCCAARALSRD